MLEANAGCVAEQCWLVESDRLGSRQHSVDSHTVTLAADTDAKSCAIT